MIRAINPATGEVVSEHEEHSATEVDRRLERAASAFEGWSRRSFDERASLVQRAASLFSNERAALARLMADEMGKPVTQGLGEVDKCAAALRYYAENAARFLGDEAIPTEAEKSFVAFRPLGAVLAIMPWNFPLWQVVRFAAPGLMAGNVGLLKHAANVPGCALALERLFREAGLPEGVFQTLLVGQDAIAKVIDDRRVAAVTLTGSTEAGRKVAARAGQALKKVVLELGGSDPYVVLADADVEHAAKVCVAARLVNAGQSCIAGKRFIVERRVLPEFQRLFVEGMAKAKIGDPKDPSTQVGPLARADLRDALHRQVMHTVEAGAKLVLGGSVPAGRGAFYPPTVLVDVQPGMAVFDEEAFGPVAALVAAEHEARALELASTTPFGLGAAVFTRDRARGERIAKEELFAGACFVNAQVKSDQRLPFGGIKDSGYGRELGVFGIREFVNVKSVWVE
ncbi:MAG TPA: NAD-dependent succinate-semialdehyde dehydrogenase [Polyangiaceae bacterium]|nr:NAD-dependent succinate-semialdehyde dehydrogenase [Polyangiaceae bacterium]